MQHHVTSYDDLGGYIAREEHTIDALCDLFSVRKPPVTARFTKSLSTYMSNARTLMMRYPCGRNLLLKSMLLTEAPALYYELQHQL